MSCPVQHSLPPEHPAVDKAPEKAEKSHSWLSYLWKSKPAPKPKDPEPGLSNAREQSTIPKNDSETWSYPSEAQFFAAMARKNHSPKTTDMKVIVPIHNAVNEQAWKEVLQWEQGRGGERCGGVKLVNFKGNPGERSWRARCKVLLGYETMFFAGSIYILFTETDTHHLLTDTTG